MPGGLPNCSKSSSKPAPKAEKTRKFTFSKLNLTFSKAALFLLKLSFEKQNSNHPLAQLSREDLDLIMELVLQSGSLKDLATAYGVSYPTIRLRLDRVISRLKELKEGRPLDPLSELLAELVQRGEVSVGAAKAVREVARAQQQVGSSTHNPGGGS